MNPDVFITIVFAGIAVLAALGGAVFVMRTRPAGKARDGRSDSGSRATIH